MANKYLFIIIVVICRPNINMILLSGLPHICPSAPNEAVEQEVWFLGWKRSFWKGTTYDWSSPKWNIRIKRDQRHLEKVWIKNYVAST